MIGYVIDNMLEYKTISTVAVMTTLCGALVVGAMAQPTLDDIATFVGYGQPSAEVGALFFCIMSLVLVILLWRPIVKRGLERLERVGLAMLCLCTVPLTALILRGSGAYWADGLLLPALYGAAAFSILAVINAYRLLYPQITAS